MEFIISSSEISKQFQLLNTVIGSSTNLSLDLDILDSFLMELKEDKPTIRASDLENTLIVDFLLKSSFSGSIALPSKLSSNILKTFDELELLSFKKKDNVPHLSSKQGNYKLPIKNAEDFPPLATFEIQNYFQIEAQILLEVINKTSFAIANDELRPVMNGLFFKFGSTGSLFVATDAHKLVKYYLKNLRFAHNGEFILPKKSLNILKNILSETKEEEKVKIELSNTHVQFSIGEKKLISRLIEGKYPNYEMVIPKQSDKKLTINRNIYLNALKRLSYFCSKTAHQVSLNCKTNELIIIAQDVDSSHEGEEKLNCKYEGEEISIGFNSKFFIEMLSKINSEKIILELSEPSKAGILKPAEEKADEELLMLIMPIVIN